jgi:uncharacterized membrane protein (UPF0127 family)
MPRFRVPRAACLVPPAVALLAACGGSPAADAPATQVTAGPTAVATVVAGGRTRLDGYGEITVTVVDAEGRTRTVCLLLADTTALQERGLMYVTDPALGGYDGMVFAYQSDDDGGFWMRHTRLPLSIAWIREDGSTVSTADMEPCPDSAATCPTYPSGGAYRFAIEVPRGRLADLGLSDRSRVSLGAAACAPT